MVAGADPGVQVPARSGGLAGPQSDRAPTTGRRDELSPAYAVAAVLAGAWLIAQETYLAFDWRHVPTSDTWQASALFTVASLWAVYALAVYGMGLRLRHTGFRLSALMVAAMATVLAGIVVVLAFAGYAAYRMSADNRSATSNVGWRWRCCAIRRTTRRRSSCSGPVGRS